MLGRSVGLSTEKLNHLGDDPLPEGVYTESEAAIVRYAQVSTSTIFINDEVYGELAKHYTEEQIVEICMVVGQYHLVAFTLRSLGVEREPGVEGLPE